MYKDLEIRKTAAGERVVAELHARIRRFSVKLKQCNLTVERRYPLMKMHKQSGRIANGKSCGPYRTKSGLKHYWRNDKTLHLYCLPLLQIER